MSTQSSVTDDTITAATKRNNPKIPPIIPYTHDIEISELINNCLSILEVIENEQQQKDHSQMDVDRGTVGAEELRKRFVAGGQVNEYEVSKYRYGDNGQTWCNR